MRSSEIYEAAKQKAFNDIRHQRDAHVPQQIEIDVNPLIEQTLFNICDENARSYSFIMEQAEKHSFEMLKKIIVDLLKKYDIRTKFVAADVKKKISPELILAFVTEKDKTLYAIHSMRIEQLQWETLKSFSVECGAKDIKIIISVYDYAYEFIFNHNNDESDPSRGTGLYSIKYLFETLFGNKEFEYFKAFEQEFTKNVRRYLGYQIIKTLTPNALFSFKKSVEYSLVSFPYKKYISELSEMTIPDFQLATIEDQFITKKYYKALIGRMDFAQSFVTAEWLYETMKEAGKIDYTAVAMGYFKAVEQLMFEIIKRHVGEGRKLKKKGRVLQEESPYRDLTEENLNNKTLDTTLGSLIGFLKYGQNENLFRDEIRSSKGAQSGILNIINQAKGDRNGYFHKDNIDDWDKIQKARVLSYVILFLLLGAYKFSEQDRGALNIPEEEEKIEFYKFCEYVNYNSGQLYYISLDGNQVIPVFAAADDDIEINEYGEAKFRGVYFRKVFGVGAERTEINAVEAVCKHTISTGDNELYKENSLPTRIYTGKMTVSEKGMIFSGPQKLIYENGRYMLPGQLGSLSY